jgi:uncharacterized protein (DUF342 family)
MNGYFRLVNEEGKTGIRLIPPTEDGKAINITDVVDYLTMKDYACDLPTLKKAVEAAAEKETALHLEYKTRFKERECYKLTITPDKMQAYAKFYPASVGGEEMTAEELVHDLELQGIVFGIKNDVIENYFAKREYLEDILIAEGTQPIQGKDAWIEYKFNTDNRAKPTLKEDGSVDFFQLNILNHCAKGEELAVLHPEEPGEAGSNLYGAPLKPRDLRKAVLKHGNNIEMSEDGTRLSSMVEGHVELVEDTVFVSDVLTVENVDPSTGNIEYEGNVQVNGNVSTNFSIKAKGDILVKGVVEGASLQAGGNIVIVRGMNGMGRGVLQAEGNIIAKFLENATAYAGGYVTSESILHSKVQAGEEVNVDGKRGFITGGTVSAAGCISVKTLGSEMGAHTVVEVGSDPKIKTTIEQLTKQIEEDQKTLEHIQPVLVSAKQKMARGIKLNAEQLQNLQALAKMNAQKTEAINKARTELEQLQKRVDNNHDMVVKVKGMAYPGAKICIGDVSMVVQKNAHYCRFVRERGDVKMQPL